MGQVKSQVVRTARLRREAMRVEVRKAVDSELNGSFEAYIIPPCALDARHDLQGFMFALLGFGLAVFHALFFYVLILPTPQNDSVCRISLLCATSMCFIFAFIKAHSQEFCPSLRESLNLEF